MTNCQCGNPLREGERECDRCLLEKYGLNTHNMLSASWKEPLWRLTPIAQALRRAEKESYKAGMLEAAHYDWAELEKLRAEKEPTNETK